MLRAALLLALLALPLPTRGQTPDPVPVGNRLQADWRLLEGEDVRIQGPGGPVEGRVRRVRGDTLFLATDAGAPLAGIRVGPDHTVERWVKRDPRKALTAGGVFVGMAGGAILGAIVGTPDPCTRSCAIGQGIVDGISRDMSVIAGAVVGGALGALTGKAIGARYVFEGWERATPEFSLRGLDAERGLAVGLTLRH